MLVCCYGNQAAKKKEVFGPSELKEDRPELNLLLSVARQSKSEHFILKSPGEIRALLFFLVMFVYTN